MPGFGRKYPPSTDLVAPKPSAPAIRFRQTTGSRPKTPRCSDCSWSCRRGWQALAIPLMIQACRRDIVTRIIARSALGIVALLVSAPGAWCRTVNMMESLPAGQAIVDHNNAQYVVRFDGPVDHRGSQLVITQGDKIVRRLRPLLDAAPEVLFASGPRLPAGDYQLNWSAKSMPDGDFTNGSIRFTVGR